MCSRASGLSASLEELSAARARTEVMNDKDLWVF